jgi:hypothetical protein
MSLDVIHAILPLTFMGLFLFSTAILVDARKAQLKEGQGE